MTVWSSWIKLKYNSFSWKSHLCYKTNFLKANYKTLLWKFSHFIFKLRWWLYIFNERTKLSNFNLATKPSSYRCHHLCMLNNNKELSLHLQQCCKFHAVFYKRLIFWCDQRFRLCNMKAGSNRYLNTTQSKLRKQQSLFVSHLKYCCRVKGRDSWGIDFKIY